MSDPLPNVISLQEAVDRASTQIQDTGFTLEIAKSYTTMGIFVKKGEFSRELWIPGLQDLYKQIASFLAEHIGYSYPRLAFQYSFSMIPVRESMVDRLALNAKNIIDTALKDKEKYSAL